MQAGIFAKTFIRATWQETLAAVKGHGLECVQFNFSCAGLPTLPEKIDPALAAAIRTQLNQLSLSMAAISGTCNLIDPDAAKRGQELARLQKLIRASKELGAGVVTLCTGTRDPQDMWRAHPDNHSTGAWNDLLAALEQLLPVAEESGIALGIEPEPANVIDSAKKARALLDQLASPRLKIVFDAANLVHVGDLARQCEILAKAVDLLGSDIVIAHAKDLARGMTGHVAAGRGKLDYHCYLGLLRCAGFDGPVILHSLSEDEVPAAVAFLQKHLTTSGAIFSR
ncbi:MAG TPA: sugar phosphate isomerase/epimerase [Verrucomicrobiae bacterium]|nr:sugar phosphate isomerase/epimerase [Verrucomicrobiae bacterium]